MAKVCKNCGATLYEGELFCTECGQKVSNNDVCRDRLKQKREIIKGCLSLIKPIILIALYFFPWYITSPDTGRLLAVDSGASLRALLSVYYHGTTSLDATMLSVSTSVLITAVMIVAIAAWIVSGVSMFIGKDNIARGMANFFTIVFFVAIFASQIFWPAIMPWLCYGNDFTSAITCFQLKANPSFNITHWGLLMFVIIGITEALVCKYIKSSRKANV